MSASSGALTGWLKRLVHSCGSVCKSYNTRGWSCAKLHLYRSWTMVTCRFCSMNAVLGQLVVVPASNGRRLRPCTVGGTGTPSSSQNVG